MSEAATRDATPFQISYWTTPESFGAIGDGKNDDGPALVLMSKWLNSGAGRGVRLSRKYRVGRRAIPQFTQKMGLEGAITLLQPDRTALVFDGGMLLIDNLTPEGLGNSFHGIVVRGPGSNVWLHQPNVSWIERPAARGEGDAIRFYGYPSDSALGAAGDGKLEFIWVDASKAKWAPQTE